jgi:hypothetical protein
MKTVLLSANQIAKILDVDVSCVSAKMANHFNVLEKDFKPNKVYNCKDLKIMQETRLFENTAIDLFGEMISQVNRYWNQVMRQILQSGACVRQIAFTGNFSGYDQLFENEHARTILDKLAEYHEQIYGNGTKEYQHYKLMKP